MHSIIPKQSNQRYPTTQAAARPWPDNINRHPYVAIAVVIIAAIVLAGGVIWWRHALQYESTDDAFIDARTITVSSQITGTIIDLAVIDNQLAAAGAVLVRIDSRDYEAALAQAKAQVAQAGAAIANLDAQIEAQKARIAQAREQIR